MGIPTERLSQSDEMPLVSCIMPTYNRRRFVPQAVGYFLRQDYVNRELIIVDDGDDAVRDLVPNDRCIRYLRLQRRHTIGAKRNLACEAARGEVMAHWDDDDWMAPWRLRYQVAELIRTQADICGLNRLLFYQPERDRAWEYRYPERERPWLAGGTLCYARTLWRDHPFLDVNVGEDTRFVWGCRGARLAPLADHTFYVALIHAGNTSPKRTTDSRWHSYPAASMHALLGHDLGVCHGEPGEAASARRISAAAPPLVSCILATGQRRAFLPQAMKSFLHQTYGNRELIIVDDGPASVPADLPDHAQIRYLKLDTPTPLGTKLNLGIEASRGEIIQKLDDDDYYHPEFLTHTVTALIGHEPERTLVGFDCFLVLIAATGEVKSSGSGWCAGGTLCFYRQLWAKRPFRDIHREVDYWFIKDHAPQRIKIQEPELYMLVRHDAGHTWTTVGRQDVTAYFKQRPNYAKSLQELVSAEDVAFYKQLASPRRHGPICDARPPRVLQAASRHAEERGTPEVPDRVGLMIKATVMDAPFLDVMVRHMVSQARYDFAERVMIVDRQPALTGKYRKRPRVSDKELDGILQQLIRDQVVDEIRDVDMAATRVNDVMRRYFSQDGVPVPTHAATGGPIYTTLFGLESMSTDRVLQMDADIFFY